MTKIGLNQNISEILKYIDNKNFQSTGAYRKWKANVCYESNILNNLTLSDVEILYQYSDIPQIIINSFNPPYYSVFDPKYQTFKCVENCLVITGNGKNGTYKVVIR